MQQGLYLSALVAWGLTALSAQSPITEKSVIVTPNSAARFLDQASWGPTDSSIAQLQQIGMNAWLQGQFALNTSDLPDQPVLTSAGKSNNKLGPVQAAFFQNAVNGQDQLRQRVAFALSEIWVVSAESGVPAAYAYPPYWRIFRDNAFGNYRDIIKAVTLSPAMGRYLNMANNNKANVAKGTAANENYARECMQLFTLGLTQLNQDGSPVVDSHGNPVPTFTQSDVTNMAKAFTGWTYPTEPAAKAKVNNSAYYVGQMIPVESEHDTTQKTIFDGVVITAGQTAEHDLESVLNALMSQPTIAPFTSKQLIQHLVTSNPSAAYVQRVAGVFESSSGNMQSVITAILTDPEARAGDGLSGSVEATFGHMREPVLFMANILRALNATVGPTNGISNDSTAMGQELFYAPSVFSYFSPQYRIAGGLLGPEFQIYSTQTAAERADIVNSAIYGALDRTTKINLQPYLQAATNTTSLIATLNTWLLHGSMSADLQQAVTSAVNAASGTQAKVQAALYIVLTSGEYQIVH